jgi:adenylate cyclase
MSYDRSETDDSYFALGQMMEIERKFLLRDLDPNDLAGFPHMEIEQHYLAGSSGVRIRRTGNRYELTIKGQGTRCRREVTKELTGAEYSELLLLCDRGLVKQRYRIGPWEIDVFTGSLIGLVLAEIELGDPDEELPPFPFSTVQQIEVTEDPRYANTNLARGDLPSG